jgi:cell shape-determining protein MreD
VRWGVFAIFALLVLSIDEGLSDLLRIESLWYIRPNFCGVLAVFVALSAPRTVALWGCFVIGLLLDLSIEHTAGGNRGVYLVGPYALGMLSGGWMVVRGRTMVFRRRALTIGVMTLLFLLVAQVVILVLLVLRSRSWYPGGPILWTDTSLGVELLRRILIAVYTGLAAMPAGWLLVRTLPLWGFQTSVHRTGGMR